MKLYKFLIRANEWIKVPDEPGQEYSGCVAVAVAESAESARAHLTRYAAENGLDGGWLGVARVIEIPLVDGAVGAWSQV